MLCAACSSINISLPVSIPEFGSSEINACREDKNLGHSQDGKDKISHQGDIFIVRAAADGGCDLCTLTITAFEKRKVQDEEIARGLPIVIPMKQNNKLIVSVESSEGLVELCGFDLYLERGE